ncbi:MAG: tetratricopeptide repeat protein, partial [Saprospiraceae bacterium]
MQSIYWKSFPIWKTTACRLFPLIAVFLLGAALPDTSGQSRRAYLRAGDEAFEQKNYGVALQNYLVALERKPEDAEAMWKSAESARLIHSYSLAEKMYLNAQALSDDKSPLPLLPFRLGETIRSQGRYAEAAEQFERFLAEQPGSELADQARANAAACRWAQQQPPPPGIEVTNAGKGVNSPFSDFAPFISGDTLFFSSYRFDKRVAKGEAKTKLTKVMLSINDGRARETTRAFPNVDSVHVAHTAFFAGGKFLFMTLCKNLNASDIRCELWLAVQDIRSRWGAPIRLPAPVNLPGYTTTHPAVSLDAVSQQMTLWFASDRPGGKGGLDLWAMPLDTNWFCPCNVPVDSRKPSRLPPFKDEPTNAEQVNTPGNDATPFFHEPTQTLYFSSDGREGFGGYDIFHSKMTGNALSTPENAGPEINTSYNDLYFTLRPDGKSGYLSSNRPGAQYLDEANKACCNDIFRVRFPEPPPPPT